MVWPAITVALVDYDDEALVGTSLSNRGALIDRQILSTELWKKYTGECSGVTQNDLGFRSSVGPWIQTPKCLLYKSSG